MAAKALFFTLSWVILRLCTVYAQNDTTTTSTTTTTTTLAPTTPVPETDIVTHTGLFLLNHTELEDNWFSETADLLGQIPQIRQPHPGLTQLYWTEGLLNINVIDSVI